MSSPRCQEATDLSRFDPYEFKFSTPVEQTFLERFSGKSGKICFEGSSHDRVLFIKTSALLHEHEIYDMFAFHPDFYSRYTLYAQDYTRGKIQAIIDKRCTKVVIGVGQWDAGFVNERPTLFPEYERRLDAAMSLMVEMFRNANVDFYVRSTQ